MRSCYNLNSLANCFFNSEHLYMKVVNGIRRKTNEQFLKELSEKHPTLTALEEYVNGRTKIHLLCNICGEVMYVQPLSLYMGHGCSNCWGNRKKTQDEFVREMAEKAPNLEVLGKYDGSGKPVEVRCKVCGRIASATPTSLLKHGGCPRCNGTERKEHEVFISEIKKKHPNIEILEKYKNNRTPIKYRCKICDKISYSTPHTLLTSGIRCNHTSGSNGENRIAKYFTDNNITFIKEYSYPDCKDIMPLPFDFYIPKYNILIEYDGQQHYKSVAFFGGKKAFEKRKLHDSIKTNYCLDNDIKLIRIPYWDFNNIEKILSSELRK